METLYFDLRDTKGQQKEIEDKISAAAKLLREGGLVGIPTETVYGLGANALDERAVARIFEAKGRPQDNPLLLHVPGAQWLARYCVDVPPLAYELARRFWPGPLTMILKRSPLVSDRVTAGLDTVGVRCPDHPVTLAIIRDAGVPVAAPSANRSGRPSCTTAEAVMEDMGGLIEGVVDGGPCVVGVESTIVDLTCQPPRLLRPGGLPVEDLERIVGKIVVDRAVNAPMGEGEQPTAPGMKYRHYAPEAPVTVFTGSAGQTAKAIADRMTPGCGILCFDEFAPLFAGHIVHTLGPSGDKLAHAQRVFDALRAFDGTGVTRILAQCPDNRGLGMAVSNRLKKAAGFHVVDVEQPQIVIGITGGTGAGKTSALAAIQELGGEVLDCDRVYDELLERSGELRRAIAETFGTGAFDQQGNLNRRTLAELVFNNKDSLDRLNRIVFAHMGAELRRRISASENHLIALDAINLLESGAGQMCDRTVAITAPLELRVNRIMARDNIDEQHARLRISAQHSDDYYRERCDEELRNDADSAETFRRNAVEFFARLIEQAKEDKANGRK